MLPTINHRFSSQSQIWKYEILVAGVQVGVTFSLHLNQGNGACAVIEYLL